MQIPNGSKLLFIGDSITDAGRDEMGEPMPTSPEQGLGSSYVNLINATILIDTQAQFDRVTKHIHPMVITWDRIHPATTGHMILAQGFLRAVGFDAP
jgi:phospholipase/lecithinase/hemolysin